MMMIADIETWFLRDFEFLEEREKVFVLFCVVSLMKEWRDVREGIRFRPRLTPAVFFFFC